MPVPLISSPSLLGNGFTQSFERLQQLEKQLATGRKVETYGDLGENRTQILSFRAEIAQITGYRSGITNIDIQIDVMLQALEEIRTIAADTRSNALEVGFEPLHDGQTVYQIEAAARLDAVVALLNERVGGRYLFGGTATEQAPVRPVSEILEGVGSAAGFRQVADERRQADLGADGRGRLVLGAAGDTASFAEDAASSPFGFKIASVASTLSGTAVTGPAGAPANVDVTFTGTLPKNGETIRVTLDLPDGTRKDVTLTAATQAPAGPGQFLVGADENATAANFNAALTAAIESEARQSLSAASLFAATSDFFDNNPPLRVDGPPFDTATALRAATPTDTVVWYQGETIAGDARNSAIAKVDDKIFVAYGASASEEPLAAVMKNLAALAVESFDTADPDAAGRYEEMKLRANAGLSFSSGEASIDGIITELGLAKTTAGRAAERHTASEIVLQGFIDDKENIDVYEVSAQILSLQFQVEASLQVTATIGRLSLVYFL